MYLRPKRGPQSALGGRGGSVDRRRRCRARSSLGDPKGRDPQEWTRLVFDYYTWKLGVFSALQSNH